MKLSSASLTLTKFNFWRGAWLYREDHILLLNRSLYSSLKEMSLHALCTDGFSVSLLSETAERAVCCWSQTDRLAELWSVLISFFCEPKRKPEPLKAPSNCESGVVWLPLFLTSCQAVGKSVGCVTCRAAADAYFVFYSSHPLWTYYIGRAFSALSSFQINFVSFGLMHINQEKQMYIANLKCFLNY